MDVAALRDCISSTLQANADIRRHAELQLKQAEQAPGFVGALINIVESEPDLNIKISAVVYLKNKVTRSWEYNDDFPKVAPVPEEEKHAFRERLVPVLASSPPQIRCQLLPLIGKILQHDFPQKWPGYMDITLQLLNAGEIQSVFAGLQCLLALSKVYRYKSGSEREDLDKVTQATFPLLLNIGNGLVTQNSTEAGEMLRLILKIYKHAIYYEMAPHLQDEVSIVPWATLFINVVAKEAPSESMLEDVDEREQHSWWKAKKWAFSNLNRLFVRYGNPAALSGIQSESYKEFSKHFINHFAPEILKAYLHQIELWVAKRAWLSKICISFIVAFMDECVKPKVTWQHLRPHVDNLVAHVMFPLLCQSDEDLELFETDPGEYLHRKINFFEEVSAPDVAATNFLVTLTRNRRKTTFTVLNFVNEIVNRYEQAPEGEKNPREKEGALRMIGTLAAIILGKKSPIANNVEYFFVRHVFPEFRSPYGYLRARACDVLEKFSELDFQDQNNIVVIYQNILQSLEDPDLPVRVEAALALQPLIRHEFIRKSMQDNIPHIMQRLLKLTNEVDVDALANVMEEFVEVFASELTPFAVELTEQLRDTYLRIVGELMEKQSGNSTEEDPFNEYLDDKSITALGVLQTIGTLILTLESTPEVLLHLENVLVPVITVTLENKLFELYNEIFEIIDSCTFSAKSISPTMWMVFELVHKTFKDRAEVYVEDMLPSLDNYITYGSEMMRQNPAYLEIIVDIIQTIFTHDKLGAMDKICGCKLAEAVMLHIKGGVDKYLAAFIEIPMQCLLGAQIKLIKSYQLHLMEMVINAVYYNPAATLQVLEQHGWTNKFFTMWFSSIDMFSRVHDKKLSIVAISALLQLQPQQIPASIQPGWHCLLQGSVRLFETLPVALKNREEISREGLTLDDDLQSDDGNDWEAEAGWGDEEKDDAEDVQDESTAYLEFLNQESVKLKAEHQFEDDESDDYAEDLEEESMLESPLDSVEPYVVFRDAFLGMKNQQPQMYENLTKSLTPEEQSVIQEVVTQAGLNEAAAAAAALQAQATSS